MSASSSTAAPLVPNRITCPLASVRDSTARVVARLDHQHAQHLINPSAFRDAHCRIDREALYNELTTHPELYVRQALPPWAVDYHYCDLTSDDAKRRTVQYIFVLDALNFCFWHQTDKPIDAATKTTEDATTNQQTATATDEFESEECTTACTNLNYEYSDLASSLKRTLLTDKNAFTAERLARLDSRTLHAWLQPLDSKTTPVHIPLLRSRTRALNELGAVLAQHFDGQAAQLVAASHNSASELVRLITAHLPMFRDACVYRGESVYLYKRAQILVADLSGAFEGKELGHFSDLSQLTCFADYRLPQLMQQLSVLHYSSELTRAIVVEQRVLQPGSEEEVAIRACTVQCVELMQQFLAEQQQQRQQQKSGDQTDPIRSQELDFLLWNAGENALATLPPHHRVRTIFY